MQPQETFKLIQCYHCLQLADHLKTTCPHKESPQTCGRCGAAGHPARECVASPRCHLCGEDGHPATARICQVYKTIFAQQLAALLSQPPSTASSNNTLPMSSPASSTMSTVEKSWEAVQLAASTAESPLDFLDTFYTIVKATNPGASSAAPPMSYGYDLDVSQDSETEAYEPNESGPPHKVPKLSNSAPDLHPREEEENSSQAKDPETKTELETSVTGYSISENPKEDSISGTALLNIKPNIIYPTHCEMPIILTNTWLQRNNGQPKNLPKVMVDYTDTGNSETLQIMKSMEINPCSYCSTC